MRTLPAVVNYPLRCCLFLAAFWLAATSSRLSAAPPETLPMGHVRAQQMISDRKAMEYQFRVLLQACQDKSCWGTFLSFFQQNTDTRTALQDPPPFPAEGWKIPPRWEASRDDCAHRFANAFDGFPLPQICVKHFDLLVQAGWLDSLSHLVVEWQPQGDSARLNRELAEFLEPVFSLRALHSLCIIIHQPPARTLTVNLSAMGLPSRFGPDNGDGLFPNLTELSLRRQEGFARLQVILPDPLRLPALKRLSLEGCKFGPEDLRRFVAGRPALELILNSCRLLHPFSNSPEPEPLRGLRHLGLLGQVEPGRYLWRFLLDRPFDLQNLRLVGCKDVTDEQLHFLQTCPDLQFFYVHKCSQLNESAVEKALPQRLFRKWCSIGVDGHTLIFNCCPPSSL